MATFRLEIIIGTNGVSKRPNWLGWYDSIISRMEYENLSTFYLFNMCNGTIEICIDQSVPVATMFDAVSARKSLRHIANIGIERLIFPCYGPI